MFTWRDSTAAFGVSEGERTLATCSAALRSSATAAGCGRSCVSAKMAAWPTLKPSSVTNQTPTRGVTVRCPCGGAIAACLMAGDVGWKSTGMSIHC